MELSTPSLDFRFSKLRRTAVKSTQTVTAMIRVIDIEGNRFSIPVHNVCTVNDYHDSLMDRDTITNDDLVCKQSYLFHDEPLSQDIRDGIFSVAAISAFQVLNPLLGVSNDNNELSIARSSHFAFNCSPGFGRTSDRGLNASSSETGANESPSGLNRSKRSELEADLF
jgi:hypothetical protein